MRASEAKILQKASVLNIQGARLPRRRRGRRLSSFFVHDPRAPARFAGIFFIDGGRKNMETRIALAGIIVENSEVTEEINRILHDYSEYIIGRMGIPYRTRGIAIISVVLDAPNDIISSLSGKLGMLKGVSVKTVYSKQTTQLNHTQGEA